jgi:lipoprotein-releasing system permease protein
MITPNIDAILAFIEGITNRNVLDAYFINYFPYYFDSDQIFLIVGFSLAITLLFAWIPAQRATKILPAQVLRHE